MKKLLLLKPYLLARSNGGEISMIEFLRHFQKEWSWEVKVVIALPEELRGFSRNFLNQFDVEWTQEGYVIDGVRCELHFSSDFHPTDLGAQQRSEKFFIEKCETEKPDLIWSHYTDFFSSSAALQYSSEKTWLHLTDNEFPRPEKLSGFERLAASYQKIQKLIVASPFMKEVAFKVWPQAETFILQRPIERLTFGATRENPQYWLFVNPVPVKGVEFVLKLAKALPQEKFLFVGNWDSKPPADIPQNIQFIPRQKNLETLFPQAKALLYPSVWEEAFGRLPLEAMSAGVPVMASDRGSLPWTVGEGGLIVGLEIQAWLDAMNRIEKEASVFQERGFQRVKEYQKEQSITLEAYRHRVGE